MNKPAVPLPMAPAPDALDPELEPLLAEPFASAWAALGEAGAARAGALRGRLLERAAAARAASSAMHTARSARLQPIELAPGVQARTLYAAAAEGPRRPGEPLRARLIAFAPGSTWCDPGDGLHREWLVLQGSVWLDAEPLQLRDYHVAPQGAPAAALRSDTGALVFLRECALPAAAGDSACTVRDEEAGWPDFAPGIQRRVLWQRDGQAALLYYAQAGAAVPLHSHGHDEECLMVQGELFLDDVLLRPGDYQLAPAGTSHHTTSTDTGAVIYAHGDLDLQFVA
jgi:ChrR Cupin-like domain